LQGRRLPYERDGLIDVGDSRKLDDEPVLPVAQRTALLGLHHRLAHAEGVDAPLNNCLKRRERVAHIGRGELAGVSRVDEMAAALEVEAELKIEAPAHPGGMPYEKAQCDGHYKDDDRPVAYGEHVAYSSKKPSPEQSPHLIHPNPQSCPHPHPPGPPKCFILRTDVSS